MFFIFENLYVIAYHEDKYAIDSYIDNLRRTHPEVDYNFRVVKMKKKHVGQSNLDDLYLVRYSDTYVQAGYLEYLSLVSDQSNYDIRYCKDVLLRILCNNSLTKKERNTIEKSVLIVSNILDECENYTPDLKELQCLKSDYDPYLYNYGSYDQNYAKF